MIIHKKAKKTIKSLTEHFWITVIFEIMFNFGILIFLI